MTWHRVVVWIAAALVWLAMAVTIGSIVPGCGAPEGNPEPLRVAAASDLEHAWMSIHSIFRARGGPEVVPTFGASGQLAEQIRQGAPFDLFLSADRRFVEKLAEEGVINADSVRPYARGSLALALDAKSTLKVEGLADLAQDGIRFVAIANPETAPYGRAAKQALERAGLLGAIGPKLVQAGSVRQALQMVQSGNAEVGIVARSVAGVPGLRSVPVPPEGHDPIDQYLGVVARSKRPGDATRFAEFLLSPDGRAILEPYGLARPLEAPGAPK